MKTGPPRLLGLGRGDKWPLGVRDGRDTSTCGATKPGSALIVLVSAGRGGDQGHPDATRPHTAQFCIFDPAEEPLRHHDTQLDPKMTQKLKKRLKKSRLCVWKGSALGSQGVCVWGGGGYRTCPPGNGE